MVGDLSGTRRTRWPGSCGAGSAERCCGAPPTTPIPTERVVVANADQLLIVVALADPPPRTGFVERALIAAYAGGLEPILCLTKTDLAPAEPFAAQFADLDLTVTTAGRDDPLDAVAPLLAGKVTVLLGHSGVGKSTLVNRLVPDADRATGEVSGVGKGRHTSTQSVALPLSRRRLGDRHPGDALVRAGAHRTRRRAAGVLGSRRGDHAVPPRVRAHGPARRSRMRAGRVGGSGRTGRRGRGACRRCWQGDLREAYRGRESDRQDSIPDSSSVIALALRCFRIVAHAG